MMRRTIIGVSRAAKSRPREKEPQSRAKVPPYSRAQPLCPPLLALAGTIGYSRGARAASSRAGKKRTMRITLEEHEPRVIGISVGAIVHACHVATIDQGLAHLAIPA